MTTVPESSGDIADHSSDALTSGNRWPETPPAETAFPCPRCGDDVVEAFYGPCFACRTELRESAATPAAPAVEDVEPARPLVSGIEATRRHWHHNRRPVVFSPVVAGDGFDSSCRRVSVTGDRLGSLAGYRMVYLCGAGAGDAVRSMFGTVVDGWDRTALHEHDRHPSVTFTRSTDGASVRFASVGVWTGSEDVEPVVAAEAWRWVSDRVADCNGGQLLATPSSTGRDLMARLLPRDAALPTLTTEVGDEIRATSTQHRMTLEAPGVEVDWFCELDMRLAFAAVVRSMPTGVPVRMYGEPDEYQPHRNARYLAEWEVPTDWKGPGILPSTDGAGWKWNGHSGHVDSGWLDGSELRLARMNGWQVKVRESLLWPEKGICDPLRTWSEKLTAMHADASKAGLPDGVGAAAGRMVRAIIIHAIGSLRGKGEAVTNTCSVDDAATMIPVGAEWWTVDDRTVMWVTRREPAWEEWCRPEWTAAVWAKTRCRLLDGPGASVGKVKGKPTGALHLPASIRLIGFRGDALYVTGDPGWHDDGAPGRFRVKSERSGFMVPATLAELDQVRKTPANTGGGPKAARAALNGGKR